MKPRVNLWPRRCELAQFSFRHNEFRRATIQADAKFREYEDDGLVNVLQSGRADAHLPNELLPVF
jgi:hypothetical protein